MKYDYEIIDGVELPLKRLDKLARRMANDVIEGRYKSAREAAVANLTEYADETTDEKRIQYQQSNFARKIVKTLDEMGFDKHGKPSYFFTRLACRQRAACVYFPWLSIAAHRNSPVNLLRMPEVKRVSGLARPTIYRDIKRGTFPKPVKIGVASAWPSAEVEAVNAARIAGKSDDDIRAIVADLERQRADAA